MENILEAVRQGDEGQVAKMLDENPRLLDRMTSYQEWPLAEAAKYGQLGVVKLLAQRGANLNEAGRFSKTALHWAVEGGHEEVVAFLLSKDVRPNDCDTSSKTPLEWACERGYMGVVRMLVQHLGQQGMDAAHTATMGLRYAARAGQKSMVKYLLGEGAQLKGDRGHDWTALIEASARGHLGVVQMLVEHMGGQGLEERDRMGNTALYHAARWGHKEVVGFLLSQGAQTTKPDLWGRTALICASMKGHLGVVQALLQHMEGQRLDERDMDGSTALYHAAFNGHELVVGFLLSQGAQANSSNNKGVTPLMGASENGHLGVVRLLVQHTGGQGLNAMDTERGWTALSWAASREHEDVMRYLLLSGADPTINDNEEEGPPLRQFYSFNRFSRERRASLEAVLEWWEGELERRHVLYRATRLHKAFTTQRDTPTSRVPTYLEARAAAGHALPSLEVVSRQSEGQQKEMEQAGASGKRKAVGESSDQHKAVVGGDEVHAMLMYVVDSLNAELLTELLEGFHGPRK